MINKCKKKGVHRRKRPRQPIPGMMIHQDASTHQWIEGVEWDLVVTMDDANRFLKQVFLPEFNQRFCVPAQIAKSAFVPWKLGNIELDDILCIQDQRIVNNDNTISCKGKMLQIPKDEIRYSYRKTKVKVHEYLDGRVAIFYGPRKLVEFSKTEAANTNSDSLENIEFLLKTFLYSSNFAQSGVHSNTVTL